MVGRAREVRSDGEDGRGEGEERDSATTDAQTTTHLAKNRMSQSILWHKPSNLGKSGKATNDMKKRLGTNRLLESSVVESACRALLFCLDRTSLNQRVDLQTQVCKRQLGCS